MSRSIERRVGLVAIALILGACTTSSHPSSTGSTASSSTGQAGGLSKVTSTLDGMTTLPSRIHWVATPEPSNAIITRVDFLIDGTVTWIEKIPPYVFGGDDSGTNLGYLVTTWLSPGSHTFAVRATGTGSASVTESVTANVGAAPSPPAALRGTWTRTLTSADLTRATPEHNPPAGRWELVFDQVGAWDLDPFGSGRIYQYEVQGDIINVYAPIQEAPVSDTGGGISRYGHHNLGDVDCNPSGPFGSYRWSVSANTLSLTPVQDGCPDRQDVWTGNWTLASPNPPAQ
jgi:hypothetical protein